MTLPVSSYEELLVQVRGLTHETILLQRQLSSDLYDDRMNGTDCDLNHNFTVVKKNYENGKLLTDSCDAVLRNQRNSSSATENNRRFDIGQSQTNNPRSFSLANNRVVNQQGTRIGISGSAGSGVNTVGGFQSGELTARLIAWQNCQLKKSKQGCHRNKDSGEESDEDSEAADGGEKDLVVPLTEAIRLFGSGGEIVKPQKFTSLESSLPSNAAPSSTEQPSVATPQQQQQQQQKHQSGRNSPQSHRRTQTRCTRVNLARSPPRTETNLPTSNKVNKEDVMEPELKEKDEHKSSTPSPELLAGRGGRIYNEDGSSEDESRPSTCSRTNRLSSLYHGTWPVERGIWNSQQTGLANQQSTSTTVHNDIASVMSFSSSMSMGVGCPGGVQVMQGQRRLGAKVDVVYSLLGMLGGAEGREDMSATLLSMSSSMDSCLAMRQSGCLPLLVQLIHAPGQDPETRERASQAIHNIVHSRGEERAGRREARVLRLLEQLRDYCQTLRTTLEAKQPLDDFDRHPGPTIAALMKLSFDEAHRHAMCQLGGLHAVAELIEMDHAAHGSECDDPNCVTLRRYAGMALTNLTFGDGNNKALLCSFREFMKALVAQLRSPSDDLRQVTASVLRNLSWRADSSSKETLREVGAVVGLTMAAMEGRKESTLKSILSALWNLSAHCSTNKIDICAVEGALAFLVDMLSYKAPSKTLAIVENAGGILRNVSSHIAVREDYRSVLRERGCLQVLLRQLRSPSLTVVSNACGALWNLSARCPQDQRMLWDLGAVPMLRSLVHSKHKMISMGSSAALKNLLGARPGSSNLVHLDSTARGLGLPTLPTLVARRQRALEQEIDQNLAETCDNIEPSTSPTNKEDKFGFKVERRFGEMESSRGSSGHSYQMQNSQPGPSSLRFNCVARSESRESVRSITSTHSDTIFERVNRHVLNGVSPTESQLKQQSSSLHSATGFNAGITPDVAQAKGPGNLDRKYVLRYKNAVPERQRPINEISLNEIADLRCTTSTMSWASAADQEAACSQILLRSSIEENSLSNELSKPLVSNRDDIKSQYLPKDNGPWQNTNSKVNNCQITTTGAIKRDLNLTQSTDCGLGYSASDIDEDEKQHSGYFAESEEEIPLKDNAKTQYKTRSSLKISREFNGDEGATATAAVGSVYESWKNQPFKERKYSFETSSLNSKEKRDNYHTDEASNSSSSMSSFSATIINDKSSSSSGLTRKLNNCDFKVEAKNDNCTLNRVSGEEWNPNRNFTAHQDESASLLSFQQYNSLDLLSCYDQDSSLASNSSQCRQSFTSLNEPLNPPAERVEGNYSQLVVPEVEGREDRQRKSTDEEQPYSINYNSFIDDEIKIANDSKLKEYSKISAGVSETEETGEPLNLSIGSILEDVEEDNEVENDADYALPVSVSREIETNRNKQQFRRSSLEKSPPPVSNLARYQTSSALNHVDVVGPVSPTTTAIPSFRQQVESKNTEIGDTGEAGAVFDHNSHRESPPLSEIIHQREDEMESGDGYLPKSLTSDRNSSKYIPDVVNEDTRPDDSMVNFNLAKPFVEDPELNLNEKVSLAEASFTKQVEEEQEEQVLPALVIVSQSENSASSESLPAGRLDEDDDDIVDAKSEKREKEVPPMPNKFVNDIASRNLFDFNLDSKYRANANVVSVDKEAVENKSTRIFDETPLSPGVSPSIKGGEDDTENTNVSEEENLSDEVMSPTLDPLFSAVERAGKLNIDRSKNREEREEEEYRRQRDPDAMIASLDRLTAALVQQTEAMRERESSAMKQSVVSDAWNEDSPNDVSFPSISVSAPLIASFKSDNQDDHGIPTADYAEDPIAVHGIMTDSRIIEREANKLAEAVNARVAEFDFEALSMTSMDLDAIKPPSSMGSLLSLTTSLIGPIETTGFDNSMLRERCNSASLSPAQLKGCSQIWADSRGGRKKSLPAGVVAKRALSQQQSHAGSLENLLNDTSACTSISHLDNVKPPSMMDELLDAMDMENSMLSVASITSEVADTKEQDSHSLTASDPVFDLLKPVANILSMTCMRYAESMQVSGNNSLSECLENINPPSLFNEVSEMDESTMMEATSETFCSDTLCVDQDFGIEEPPIHDVPSDVSIDRIEECDNDTDEAATPIPSEYCVSSSAESTPKKRPNKNHLTPKQKRQLAKERYKTYTIAAEMVKKEEEERRKHDNEESRIGKYVGAAKNPAISKLTPKQRRQEDRARFQTQVLNNPFPVLGAFAPSESQPPLGDVGKNFFETEEEEEEPGSVVKSGIPKLRKISDGRTIKQKRAENKDRYRTRTLDDEEAQEASKEVDVIISGARFADSDTSLETMLHVTPRGSETVLGQGEDLLIDCETLSLVSNDSENDNNNFRFRFTNGLSKINDTNNAELVNCAQNGFVSRFCEEREGGRQEFSSKSSSQDLESLEDPKAVRNSDSESDDESNGSANEQSMVPKRPRIVKPGAAISREASLDSNATDKSEAAESPKTIRGRRKALYSNPTTRKSTPHTSPSKIINGGNGISGIPIGRSNTAPLVRGTRATTLRQTHNPSFATKGQQQKSVFNSKNVSSTATAVAGIATAVEKRTRASGSAFSANRTSIPQRGTVFNYSKSTKRHTTPSASFAPTYPPPHLAKEEKKEPAIKPLERQGTFTKEEPEVENAPTVLPPCSPSKSKIAKPIKTSPSKIQPPGLKLKPIVKQPQNPQSKIGKISAGEKEQTKSSSSSSSSSSMAVYQRRSLIGSPIKNSPSNQSLQSNDSGRAGKKTTNPLGQRSNSNSSIVSTNSSTGIQGGRRTTKEATSKIASLWKRVEESKTKQRFEKNDTRHWITPVNGGEVETGNSVITSKPPAFRLIRSSTFEGVTKDASRNVGGASAMGKPKQSTAGKRQQPSKTTTTTDSQNVVRPKYRNSCDLSGVSIAEAPCKIPTTKYTDTKIGPKRDTVQIGDTTIILRKQQTAAAESSAEFEVDPTKRVSRLGSFIRVDPPENDVTQGGNLNTARTAPASAIVPPFNYNPKQSSPIKGGMTNIEDGKIAVTECQVEITTSSIRVTTV